MKALQIFFVKDQKFKCEVIIKFCFERCLFLSFAKTNG